jgi:hypothetical protein
LQLNTISMAPVGMTIPTLEAVQKMFQHCYKNPNMNVPKNAITTLKKPSITDVPSLKGYNKISRKL